MLNIMCINKVYFFTIFQGVYALKTFFYTWFFKCSSKNEYVLDFCYSRQLLDNLLIFQYSLFQ